MKNKKKTKYWMMKIYVIISYAMHACISYDECSVGSPTTDQIEIGIGLFEKLNKTQSFMSFFPGNETNIRFKKKKKEKKNFID